MSTYRTHRHARGEQIRTDEGTDLAFRIAAFGAIRRAAAVARECDFIADEHADISYTDGEFVERDRARCIRQAIRHAIGSEKA